MNYAQQVDNQYTSDSASVSLESCAKTTGLPANHMGFQSLSPFGRWTPNVSMNCESHSTAMAGYACTEYSATTSSSSGEYN